MNDTQATLREAIGRLGLPGDVETAEMSPLTGGVSSDIWRVDLPEGPVCVKRALSKLKVAADWRVPVARSGFEMAWLAVVGEIDSRAVPRLLAGSAGEGLFAMEYLDPVVFPQWKGELMAGRIDRDFAAEVGRRLVRIHSATAGDGDIAAQFGSDEIFHAIRLEPYLEASARRHPDLAPVLGDLVSVTASTRRALVHGDVSPKNILTGPRGPIFLDAECAWYGDPAFDLTFCLNHLLLKCVLMPERAAALLACFDALAETYLAGVDWEPRDAVDARAARLLPGLMLARVDGKSPVEYLTRDSQQTCVRHFARHALTHRGESLAAIRRDWAGTLPSDSGGAL